MQSLIFFFFYHNKVVWTAGKILKSTIIEKSTIKCTINDTKIFLVFKYAYANDIAGKVIPIKAKRGFPYAEVCNIPNSNKDTIAPNNTECFLFSLDL